MEIDASTLNCAAELLERLKAAIGQAVVGQADVIEQVGICLCGSGHGRFQFPPDMMPSDIIGHAVLDPTSHELRIVRGPVFTHILLADEINRAPAKTQSALLEVMQEYQVTLEGQTLALPKPFIVLATQNPVETEGTYPLPEAQLDRFLLKIEIGYPGQEDEVAVVLRTTSGQSGDQLPLADVKPRLNERIVLGLQQIAA